MYKCDENSIPKTTHTSSSKKITHLFPTMNPLPQDSIQNKNNETNANKKMHKAEITNSTNKMRIIVPTRPCVIFHE